MTNHEFQSLCGDYLLDVGLALENDEVRQALTDRDDDEVRRLILEEF